MSNALVVLQETKTGKGVVASCDIEKGEVIFEFEKSFVNTPTNKTLRISEHVNQLSGDPSAIENFVNHSCEPNAYIDFDALTLNALKPILKGTEVTYNYFTSDWGGEDDFECKCGAITCVRQVRGFRYLPREEKLKIVDLLSPFIRKKFGEMP